VRHDPDVPHARERELAAHRITPALELSAVAAVIASSLLLLFSPGGPESRTVIEHSATFMCSGLR
jgi:hypothetical protein